MTDKRTAIKEAIALGSIDTHRRAASIMFDVLESEVTLEQRVAAKNLNMALVTETPRSEVALRLELSEEELTALYQAYDRVSAEDFSS